MSANPEMGSCRSLREHQPRHSVALPVVAECQAVAVQPIQRLRRESFSRRGRFDNLRALIMTLRKRPSGSTGFEAIWSRTKGPWENSGDFK